MDKRYCLSTSFDEWAGDRLPRKLGEDTLPLCPAIDKSKGVPLWVHRKRLPCYPRLSVRTFRREVLSLVCVSVACVFGAFVEWGAREPGDRAAMCAQDAPSTNTFPQGACFLSGAMEGESEENPQAKRARDGERAVPEGRYSCEASALQATFTARRRGSRGPGRPFRAAPCKGRPRPAPGPSSPCRRPPGSAGTGEGPSRG